MHTHPNIVPEMSVSEIASAIKHIVENTFNRVRVRGELSGVTHHRSGHIYMDIKDQNANMRTVCWRSNVGNLKIRPENGLEVVITGRITTYGKNSTYQLVVGTMEIAGIGALLAMLEKRKATLQAEGLFDPSRKKPLPFLPRAIGVITSPSGAVIRDILHRVKNRFALPVLIYPAKVQGDGTETDIVNGIQFFNNPPAPITKPDVILIARGGGSMEDLWAFNDESIVRAVAQSHIPIVSAIGHETDTTLIDYVADVRAPTPTAAAEMAVPVKQDLRHTLQSLSDRYTHATHRICKRASDNLTAHKIPPLRNIIHIKQNQYTTLTNSLTHHMQTYTNTRTLQLIQTANRCTPPTAKIGHYSQRIAHLDTLKHRSITHMLSTHNKRLAHTGALLSSYSYKNILNRGFALVQSADGTVITQKKTAQTQADLRITFADGTVQVTPKP